MIVTGTRPIGQTVIRRARAAGLIMAEVEGARRDGYVTHERDEDPADWVKAPVPC